MKLAMKVEYYPGERGDFLGVDEKACTGCGDCAKFCPRDVWVEESPVFKPKNIDACVECGACWNICSFDAVRFSEPAGGTGVIFGYG
jgi:NAD-dependent dihydropyrimidine dehydrogenase PreA subunit